MDSDASERRWSAMDEEEEVDFPTTLQEELNEILEAFYAAVSEEDIRQYQRLVEDITHKKVAEGAVKPISTAPNFELEDQDGDIVCLKELLSRGPVVLVFYRGKWCPHCQATLMRLQRELEKIKAKGASLVAISPMLPDGTQYLATKRCLEFPVCSDLGNSVAKEFNITFEVMPEVRDTMTKWGEHLPAINGDETWEIPLPATYVIHQNGDIIWHFIDDDPGIRAEMDDIVAAIPAPKNNPKEDTCGNLCHANTTPAPNRRCLSATFKNSFKKVFGKKRQSAQDFLGNYMLDGT